MSRYEDALFQQQQQLRFLRSEMGKQYMLSFQRDFEERRSLTNYGGSPNYFHTITMMALENAEPIYVAPDVTEIIDEARKSFEPEPIMPSDPITQAGFAYFPRSIEIIDRKGATNFIRAMLWVPVLSANRNQVALWYATFSHEDDPLVFHREWGNEMPHMPKWRRDISPLAELQLLHGTSLPLSVEFNSEDFHQDGVTYPDAAKEMWALPQTVWRIAQQLVPAREPVGRSWRRDAARHGLQRDDVTVIRLRKTKSKTDHETEVEWSNQWIVRGHWRNQWYASIKTHRQIWINPFVKGPDDKPLKITKRVWEFIR